jgi:hypothetical protein
MLTIAGAMLAMTVPASATIRFGGGFVVGPHPWGWYRPYFYGPYWPSYGYYGPYYGYPNAGQIKIDTNVKNAEVYINGAYAGPAGKLKSMWLRPDTYNLEIRAPGCTPFAERIYVMAGKTLKVHADLGVQPRG